jgi:hypothetical protein
LRGRVAPRPRCLAAVCCLLHRRQLAYTRLRGVPPSKTILAHPCVLGSLRSHHSPRHIDSGAINLVHTERLLAQHNLPARHQPSCRLRHRSDTQLGSSPTHTHDRPTLRAAGSLQGVPASCCGRRVAVWSGRVRAGHQGLEKRQRRASSLRTWRRRVRRSPCPSSSTAHPPYVPHPSAVDHVDRTCCNV